MIKELLPSSLNLSISFTQIITDLAAHPVGQLSHFYLVLPINLVLFTLLPEAEVRVVLFLMLEQTAEEERHFFLLFLENGVSSCRYKDHFPLK